MMAVEVENVRFSLGPKLMTIWPTFLVRAEALALAYLALTAYGNRLPPTSAMTIQVQVQT